MRAFAHFLAVPANGSETEGQPQREAEGEPDGEHESGCRATAASVARAHGEAPRSVTDHRFTPISSPSQLQCALKQPLGRGSGKRAANR
jgi:hypothetical protein